jgi:4-alpha-glucanotransferase
MSDKIKLAFCVHSHQPVGNYPAVFEQGARDCYLPFLRLLKEYPEIRMTLHYTGPLLEWFEGNSPEFFELLAELVSRSQVELMGGGFYEPIMPVIPEQDARKQIDYTKNYFKDKFGVVPRGIWCAERIWDPSLPKKIQAGTAVEYTLMDDSHFLSAGLCPEDVHGYYITEREGHALKVFPIDMQLRYIIPFKEPYEIINYLRHLKSRGVKVVTYGDDGEKFGMWPGTHKWVLEQGWLKRFFDAMLEVSKEIEIVTLSSVLDTYPPNGLIYIPTATYQEMMEWSLLAPQGRYYEELVKKAKSEHDWDRMRAFLRGGMWDNFLSKYRESNLMHKKMLNVSSLVHKDGDDVSALKHLFMGQCNCAYWHGLFGGIYISALRHAIYENLLKAEQIVDERRLAERSWVIDQTDYDVDGRDEILISGRTLNCFISPHFNASVFALEYKPKHYNLSNILMRHPEIYHKDVMNPQAKKKKAAGEPLSIHDIPHETSAEFKELLIYDTYPRNSFITHYLQTPASVEKILKENRIESSSLPYLQFKLTGKLETAEGVDLTFSGSQNDVNILKTYRYNATGSISLSHLIAPLNENTWVVLEWNIFILTGAKPLVDSLEMESDRGVYRAQRVEILDEWKGVHVCLESNSYWVVCIVPIECISQSEEGFEKSFQGWSIYFMMQCKDNVPDVMFKVNDACRS